MGPLPDREAAERAVLKLKAEGHAATIVTPASDFDLCILVSRQQPPRLGRMRPCHEAGRDFGMQS